METKKNGVAREALREFTAEIHQKLEVTPFGHRVFAEDFSATELASILGRMVSVYRPLEAQLINKTPASSLNYRPRLPLLLAGLAALRAEPPSPMNDLKIQLPDEPAARMGAIYVIEGSTMGGQKIYEQLAPRFSRETISFFFPHEEQTSANWKAFRKELEISLSTPESLNLAKTAAMDTFEKFHQILAN